MSLTPFLYQIGSFDVYSYKHFCVLCFPFHQSPAAEETPEANAAKRSKKGDPLDEDVDIGDEMPATVYPSVEIAKESSSSSSGSDSSSSNGKCHDEG